MVQAYRARVVPLRLDLADAASIQTVAAAALDVQVVINNPERVVPGIIPLEMLAAGDSVEDVLEAFPSLQCEQVLSCMDHAARLMGNQYSFESVA